MKVSASVQKYRARMAERRAILDVLRRRRDQHDTTAGDLRRASNEPAAVIVDRYRTEVGRVIDLVRDLPEPPRPRRYRRKS